MEVLIKQHNVVNVCFGPNILRDFMLYGKIFCEQYPKFEMTFVHGSTLVEK